MRAERFHRTVLASAMAGWSTAMTPVRSRTASPTSAAATAALRCARPARMRTRATCGTCSTPAPRAASKTSPTPSLAIRWIRHPHRTVVRTGAHHPRLPPALPSPWPRPSFCPHGRPQHCPASIATTTPTSAPHSARTVTTKPGRSRSTGTPPNCGGGSPSPCAAGRRPLGIPRTTLREYVTVSFAKVAEFQRRGVVHFHALVRVDGPGAGNPRPRSTSPLSSWATRSAPPPPKPSWSLTRMSGAGDLGTAVRPPDRRTARPRPGPA